MLSILFGSHVSGLGDTYGFVYATYISYTRRRDPRSALPRHILCHHERFECTSRFLL